MMKTKTKLSVIIALLIGVAFTYTACKKSSSQPSGPALTPKQLSSQIALNIGATLNGSFGGFNLHDGLNSPTTLGLLPKGRLRTSSTNDPLCGTTDDSPINLTSTDNGETTKIAGDVKVTYHCTGGILSGFTFFDDLTVSQDAAEHSIAVKLGENITIIAQTPSDDNSKFTIDGTVGFSGTYNYKSGANKGSGTTSFNYTYKTILVDPNKEASIVSGSADFSTKGAGTQGSWDYQGTIVFLGNNKVKITINGEIFTVDMTTGE